MFFRVQVDTVEGGETAFRCHSKSGSGGEGETT